MDTKGKSTYIELLFVLGLIVAAIVFVLVGTDVTDRWFGGKSGSDSSAATDNATASQEETEATSDEDAPDTAPAAPTIPDEVLATPIFFQKSAKLYKILLSDKQAKEVLPKVDSYSLSPDKTKLAYIEEYGVESESKEVHILNLKTNGEKTITTDSSTNRDVSWSPNEKYLLVNSGTGTMGSTGIYEVSSGKKVYQFGQAGTLDWINDVTFVLVDGQKVSTPRPWGSGDGMGLAVIKLPDGKKTVLKKADATTDYALAGVKDGNIEFSQKKVGDANDWVDPGSAKETYWSIKPDGTKLTEISDPRADEKRIKAEIASNLSEDEQKENPSITYVEHDKLKNWALFEVYVNGSVYDQDIYVINLDDPNATLTKVAVGGNVQW